jgi:hypothetical protein
LALREQIITGSKPGRSNFFRDRGIWKDFLSVRTKSRQYGVGATDSDLYAQGVVCIDLLGEKEFSSEYPTVYSYFLKARDRHLAAVEHFERTGEAVPMKPGPGKRLSGEMQKLTGLRADGSLDDECDFSPVDSPPTISKPTPGRGRRPKKVVELALGDVDGIVRDEAGNVVFGGVTASAKANVVFAFDALARAQLGEAVRTDQFPSPASWMLFRDAFTSPLEKDELKKMYAKMIDKNSDDDDSGLVAGENLGIELEKIMNFERTVDHTVISG